MKNIILFGAGNQAHYTIDIIEKENKYNIIHDNTIAVYYRGTDKYKETQLAPFDEFYRKILHLVNINENK